MFLKTEILATENSLEEGSFSTSEKMPLPRLRQKFSYAFAHTDMQEIH